MSSLVPNIAATALTNIIQSKPAGEAIALVESLLTGTPINITAPLGEVDFLGRKITASVTLSG